KRLSTSRSHALYLYTIPRPPTSTLFPYTTLFRSIRQGKPRTYRTNHGCAPPRHQDIERTMLVPQVITQPRQPLAKTTARLAVETRFKAFRLTTQHGQPVADPLCRQEAGTPGHLVSAGAKPAQQPPQARRVEADHH